MSSDNSEINNQNFIDLKIPMNTTHLIIGGTGIVGNSILDFFK
jgi:hypothetical protein